MPDAVLQLADCLNPGGTERQLIEQCRRLDRARFRPLVGAFHAGGTLKPELDALSIPVGEFPLRRSLAHPNTAWQVARLAAWCRREKVRILHAHDFYANLVGLAVARLAGARLICSRRDIAHWLSPAKQRALAFACRAADRVVANARAVMEQSARELGVPRARFTLVRNGIDLARFDAEAARAPDPAPPASELPALIAVGNMNLPDKGQADLIDAAALLAARGRPLALWLVGDGPCRPALEAQAGAAGVSAHFFGRRFDVPRLLARADLACSPSWAEGFPNALAEAMAARLPTVATRVGGCPELIEHGVSGLLVPPHDPAALADALGSLLADRERARAIGQQARARVERELSMERAAADLDRLYRELLGERRNAT